MGSNSNAKKAPKLVLQTKKSVQSLSDLPKVTKKIINTTRELMSSWIAITQQSHCISHLSSIINGPFGRLGGSVGWASAFGSGRDPRVLRSSPA